MPTWTYSGGTVFTPAPENLDIATQAELDAHTADTADAHDASAISFVPTGTLAATDAQAAVAEAAGEAASALAAHESDSTLVHGIADTSALALTAAVQPLDSDLTAIAALTTTSHGRSYLAATDAAAVRTLAGAEASGAAAAAQAASQPIDSDLTAIAALSTTSYGRSLLEAANAAAARTLTGAETAGAAVAAQAASQPLNANLTAVTTGTYTPTLTNVANVDSSTAAKCQYMRVGSMVTVSGKLTIDATTSNLLTRVGMSLPVASNFAVVSDCGGATATTEAAVIYNLAVVADVTNDRAEFYGNAGASTARIMHFIFMYEVIA